MSLEKREYGKMQLEQVQNALVLTFTNPSVLNALSSEVLRQLSRALDDAEAAVISDRRVRSLVLTGEGRAFIAGAVV